MITSNKLNDFNNFLLGCDNVLIIQDIDGVCIPLVKNPLDREIQTNYVSAASKLKDDFFVLTCGEHEGRRGVNRIIERAFKSKIIPLEKGLYLPGLAACGVEYQDKYGNIEIHGLRKDEINFLKEIPSKIKDLLYFELKSFMPYLSDKELIEHTNLAVCDTRFSPAINLNGLFKIQNDVKKQKELQLIVLRIMEEVIKLSNELYLNDSFHLHISPNLGIIEGKEVIKLAKESDIGTTDIQLIIKGAKKEAGLLVLINKYIEKKTGRSPLGRSFNVKDSPKSIKQIISFCRKKISAEEMPTLIGVGDTVTSSKKTNQDEWLRGGSDRGFLTLIKELGKAYGLNNKVIFVSSGNDQVYRPSVNNEEMSGVSDQYDPLQFDLIMNDGPEEYIKWFIELANNRS